MRFNGINPSDLSPKIFVSHETISAIPPRELQLVNTGRQAYLSGVKTREREIHLHLNFAGKNKSHANELARIAAGLFCTDEPGEYEPSHMQGMALTAILESASDPEWHWGFGVIEYVFKAPRPYFHATAETILTGTSTVRMSPRGTVPCCPVVSHVMAAAANALEITLNSATVMRIRNPAGTQLAAGVKVTVDFANRLVTINNDTAMNFVDYTASDWHPDITGAAVIGLSDAGSTTVRWRDEWI